MGDAGALLLKPSTNEPAAVAAGSSTGKHRILRAAAALLGLVLAASVGWWLSPGSDDGISGRVVELDMPPKIPAEAGGVLTPPAQDPSMPPHQVAEPAAAAPASVSAEGKTSPGTAETGPETEPGESADVLPDPSLIEPGASGPLPRIADDGREPWRAYAGDFDSRDDRPRLVVIVTGLGLEPAATEAAIRRLPAPVTLALNPYAENDEHWARMGRRFGHEVLLSVPLESADFPFEDPGPDALLTSLSPQENLHRLEFLLSRFTGYVGVIGVMGSKFNRNDASIRPVLQALRGRGLMYVEGTDSGKSVAPVVATEIGLPRALADLSLDDVPSKEAIDRQLARLEEIARERAVAVALARPYPVTLDRLAAWAATLDERDLVLAPVTAVADAQFLP
jgi:polysaccharide deacetylase 2 family uncharacterized protein YibQ